MQAGPARPLARPAKLLVGLLILGIVADTVALVVELNYLGVLNDLAAGVDVPFEDVNAADNRETAAALFQVGTYVLAIVGFIVWFRRAYRNLTPLGAKVLRYKPGWAVGAWFVPFLNLWRPKQIANDIWRGTSEDGPSDGWHERSVAKLVGWWWALFLLTSWVGNAAGRSFFSAESLSEQQSASSFQIFADGVSVASGVVAIVFVRALTKRQDDLIASGPAPASAQATTDEPPPLASAAPA